MVVAGCAARAERIVPPHAYLPGGDLAAQRVADVSVRGGRASTFWTTPHLSDDAYRAAVERALHNADALQPDGRYHLDAEIMEEHQSGGSLYDPDIGVTLRVRYTLTDRQNEAVVWQDTIETGGFIRGSEVFVGLERARRAIEQAASLNLDKMVLRVLTVLKKRAAGAV